ncbi:MAG: glycosyltransferase [Melioribacteraceae bacterium]|nr:glycosyltransferase [Melioribacteraceae bacterium]MCF8356501.1 glycosyltransferase [Melioribacteraceae bacterium]MCF8395889.1 glycosyltransferase [Melioribacteraceae bacterium]MCF8420948.1 glycosyltransferase [Melioribacteraceae bacterium]
MIDIVMPVPIDVPGNELISGLEKSRLVNKIFLLSRTELESQSYFDALVIDSFQSSDTMNLIARNISAEYILLLTQQVEIELQPQTLGRFLRTAMDTGAGILYSDYFLKGHGEIVDRQVIDYQPGSIRDNFEFGPLMFIEAASFKAAVQKQEELHYSGLYDLRLRISESKRIIRIPEKLYTAGELDTRKTGEKQFDYVDPKNRSVQIEMERAATEHLKRTGAYLKPEFETIKFTADEFENTASVIIPVKNRAATIEDAVKSALQQKTNFPFNIIIVDNHSSDGTTEKIRSLKDERIIHIIPKRNDLGIGGCWNLAVNHPECGLFSIQLDSDDLYKDDSTLQKIVDKFYQEKCAMVIGSYIMTDFDLTEIPPGLIDHKEWTEENGRNNALRINGLGAPRAFYTPILRKIGLPNVSYGEDYFIGLAISRNYKIGRIYEPLYLCRRWEGNSDAALDIKKENEFNHYKDFIRTSEILARQKMNAQND